jgi:hypothetical protein
VNCKLTTALKAGHYEHTCSVCHRVWYSLKPDLVVPCGTQKPQPTEEEIAPAAARLGVAMDEARWLLSHPQLGTPEEILANAKTGDEKLGVSRALGKIPATMKPMLARWVKAGMPERANEEDAMEVIRRIECEDRSVGGFCKKIGCGKDADKNVPCMMIYRMVTEKCPGSRFDSD